MHQASGRWRRGLALALLASFLWSILPIALKVLLEQMDAITVTWYRFAIAAAVLFLWQARRGALPRLRSLGAGAWRLLGIAVVGITANYLLYLLGLDYMTADAAQMVIQLAPVLLLVGGLVIFRERFSPAQWLGLVALLVGLALFFNHRVAELIQGVGPYGRGIALVTVSAFAWAGYALAQKQLLRDLSSVNIMLLLYAGGVLVFLAPADLRTLGGLDALGLALLAFASVNTLFAYGAFAEALDHWEASRVSAVLAITPLLTLACTAMLSRVTELVVTEPLNALSMAGGLLVVGGSMAMALAGRRRRRPPAAANP